MGSSRRDKIPAKINGFFKIWAGLVFEVKYENYGKFRNNRELAEMGMRYIFEGKVKQGKIV